MRIYNRKTNRGVAHDVLLRAANEVLHGGRSKKGVAADFNIDRMTLSRFVEKVRNAEEGAQVVSGYEAVANAKRVFSIEMERDLSEHITHLADMFYGLSQRRCRALACDFAMKNNVSIPKSWIENGMAGEDWWLGFADRHKMSIRSAEATSLARARAFNRPVVTAFFNNLAAVLEKESFPPSRIFNCDETGCSTVQPPKAVVTKRGTKQVGAVTSQERGELVTVAYAINASGSSLPPCLFSPE